MALKRKPYNPLVSGTALDSAATTPSISPILSKTAQNAALIAQNDGPFWTTTEPVDDRNWANKTFDSVFQRTLGTDDLVLGIGNLALGDREAAQKRLIDWSANEELARSKGPEAQDIGDIKDVGSAASVFGYQVAKMIPDLLIGGLAGGVTKGLAKEAVGRSLSSALTRKMLESKTVKVAEKKAAEAAVRDLRKTMFYKGLGNRQAELSAKKEAREVASDQFVYDLQKGAKAFAKDSPLAKNIGNVGFAAGATAGSLPGQLQEQGQFALDNVDTLSQEDTMKLLAGSTLAASTDFLPMMAFMGRFSKEGVQQAMSADKFAKRILKAYAGGFAAEGGQEAVQAFITRGSQHWVDENVEMLSDEAMQDYFMNFVAGGFIGGGLGGAGEIGSTAVRSAADAFTSTLRKIDANRAQQQPIDQNKPTDTAANAAAAAVASGRTLNPLAAQAAESSATGNVDFRKMVADDEALFKRVEQAIANYETGGAPLFKVDRVMRNISSDPFVQLMAGNILPGMSPTAVNSAGISVVNPEIKQYMPGLQALSKAWRNGMLTEQQGGSLTVDDVNAIANLLEIAPDKEAVKLIIGVAGTRPDIPQTTAAAIDARLEKARQAEANATGEMDITLRDDGSANITLPNVDADSQQALLESSDVEGDFVTGRTFATSKQLQNENNIQQRAEGVAAVFRAKNPPSPERVFLSPDMQEAVTSAIQNSKNPKAAETALGKYAALAEAYATAPPEKKAAAEAALNKAAKSKPLLALYKQVKAEATGAADTAAAAEFSSIKNMMFARNPKTPGPYEARVAGNTSSLYVPNKSNTAALDLGMLFSYADRMIDHLDNAKKPSDKLARALAAVIAMPELDIDATKIPWGKEITFQNGTVVKVPKRSEVASAQSKVKDMTKAQKKAYWAEFMSKLQPTAGFDGILEQQDVYAGEDQFGERVSGVTADTISPDGVLSLEQPSGASAIVENSPETKANLNVSKKALEMRTKIRIDAPFEIYADEFNSLGFPEADSIERAGAKINFYNRGADGKNVLLGTITEGEIAEKAPTIFAGMQGKIVNGKRVSALPSQYGIAYGWFLMPDKINTQTDARIMAADLLRAELLTNRPEMDDRTANIEMQKIADMSDKELDAAFERALIGDFDPSMRISEKGNATFANEYPEDVESDLYAGEENPKAVIPNRRKVKLKKANKAPDTRRMNRDDFIGMVWNNLTVPVSSETRGELRAGRVYNTEVYAEPVYDELTNFSGSQNLQVAGQPGGRILKKRERPYVPENEGAPTAMSVAMSGAAYKRALAKMQEIREAAAAQAKIDLKKKPATVEPRYEPGPVTSVTSKIDGAVAESKRGAPVVALTPGVKGEPGKVKNSKAKPKPETDAAMDKAYEEAQRGKKTGNKIIMDDESIDVHFGKGGKWAFLSNLARRPFDFGAMPDAVDKDGNPVPAKFVSVEHAYQTLKSGTFDKVAYEKGKTFAKYPGTLVADKANTLPLMRELMLASFKANPAQARKLVATGDANFTHAVTDKFWALNFPKLLTEVRTELAAEAKEAAKDADIADIKTERVKTYDVALVKANPTTLYVFGDNAKRYGKKGQAVIRDEPNAFGIATKDAWDTFMSDDNFERNKATIDNDIAAIKAALGSASYKALAFPTDGVGTGLAQLSIKAPKTAAYLNAQLKAELGIDNIVADLPSSSTFEIVKPENSDVVGMRYKGKDITNTKPNERGWLGNPFVAEDVNPNSKYTRGKATEAFKKVFLDRIASDPDFKNAVLALRGKKVGYYAPDKEHVHLRVVQEWLANQPMSGQKAVRGFAALPAYKPGQKTMRYAGVGSRETPPAVLVKMTEVAKILESKGYTLQSGGAVGADSAFENGVTSKKQIFYAKDATPETIEIAKELHPNPSALTEYPLKLMARNTFQVFGKNLDEPVDFVLAWTKDGAETSAERNRSTGGTGQAIDMASRKGVPVINMAKPGWQQKLQAVIDATPTTAVSAAKTDAKESTVEKLRALKGQLQTERAEDALDYLIQGGVTAENGQYIAFTDRALKDGLAMANKIAKGWATFPNSGTFDEQFNWKKPKGTPQPSEMHDFVDELDKAGIAKIRYGEQKQLTPAQAAGKEFTLGVIADWTERRTVKDNVVSMEDLCLHTSSHTVWMLQASGYKATTAFMGVTVPGGAQTRKMNHYVAVVEIDGTRFVVDQPQGEFFDPTGEGNNVRILTRTFTPRFIPIDGLAAAYNTPDVKLMTYANKPPVALPLDSVTIQGVPTTAETKAKTKAAPEAKAAPISAGVKAEPVPKTSAAKPGNRPAPVETRQPTKGEIAAYYRAHPKVKDADPVAVVAWVDGPSAVAPLDPKKYSVDPSPQQRPFNPPMELRKAYIVSNPGAPITPAAIWAWHDANTSKNDSSVGSLDVPRISGTSEQQKAAVRGSLVRTFGEKTVRALENAGFLSFKTAEEARASDYPNLNNTTQGYAYSGRVTFITDRVPNDRLKISALLIHEAVHAWMPNMLGIQEFTRLTNTHLKNAIELMSNNPGSSKLSSDELANHPVWQLYGLQRMRGAMYDKNADGSFTINEDKDQRADEALAYQVQYDAAKFDEMPWFKKIVTRVANAIKMMLWKHRMKAPAQYRAALDAMYNDQQFLQHLAAQSIYEAARQASKGDRAIADVASASFTIGETFSRYTAHDINAALVDQALVSSGGTNGIDDAAAAAAPANSNQKVGASSAGTAPTIPGGSIGSAAATKLAEEAQQAGSTLNYPLTMWQRADFTAFVNKQLTSEQRNAMYNLAHGTFANIWKNSKSVPMQKAWSLMNSTGRERVDATLYYLLQAHNKGELKLDKKAQKALDYITLGQRNLGMITDVDLGMKILSDMKSGKLLKAVRDRLPYQPERSLMQVNTKLAKAGRWIADATERARKLFANFITNDYDRAESSGIPSYMELVDLIMPRAGNRMQIDKQTGLANYGVVPALAHENARWLNRLSKAAGTLDQVEQAKVLKELYYNLPKPRAKAKLTPKEVKAFHSIRKVYADMYTYAAKDGVFNGKNRRLNYTPVLFDIGGNVEKHKATLKRVFDQRGGTGLTDYKYEAMLDDIYVKLNPADKGKTQVHFTSLKPNEQAAFVNRLVENAFFDPSDLLLDNQMGARFKFDGPRVFQAVFDMANTTRKYGDLDALISTLDPSLEQHGVRYIEPLVAKTVENRLLPEKKFVKLYEAMRAEGATQEDLDAAERVYNSAFNRYKFPVMGPGGQVGSPTIGMFNKSLAMKMHNRSTLRTMQNLGAWQNLRLLPLALLSSLVDPGGLVIRSGGRLTDSLTAMKDGIKGLVDKDTQAALFAAAEAIGYSAELNAAMTLQDGFGAGARTPFARSVNSWIFKVNQMEAWTRQTRLMAVQAANSYLTFHQAQYRDPKVSAKDKAYSKAVFEKLGLQPDDVRIGHHSTGPLKGRPMVLVYSPQQLKNASKSQRESDARVKAAMVKWVDEAILRPNVVQTPTWHKDPFVKLITQYKAFSYSIYEQLSRHAFSEIRDGNYAVLNAALIYLPVALMAELLREFLQHGPDGNPQRGQWTGTDYVGHAVVKTGLLGPTFDFQNGLFNDAERGGVIGRSFAGPTVGSALDVGGAIAGQKSVGKVAESQMPLSALWKNWNDEAGVPVNGQLAQSAPVN